MAEKQVARKRKRGPDKKKAADASTGGGVAGGRGDSIADAGASAAGAKGPKDPSFSQELMNPRRKKQEELDGKGVRLQGRLARKLTREGSQKQLHLGRLLEARGGEGPPEGSAFAGGGALERTNKAVEEDEEEEGDDEEEEEEEEGEEGFGTEQTKRQPIYNVEGIHEKLEDFGWCEDAEWIETLAVTHDDDTAEHVDVNDDLAREVALYSQAAECAKVGLSKLKDLGVPVVRPKDFYAEMVKGDKHMTKVQARLLTEQKELEEKQERRKQREAKKYAREVQAQKQRERQRAKKEDIQAVEKWRKMREKSGFEGEGEELPPGLEGEEGDKGGKGGKRGGGRHEGANVKGGKAPFRKGPSKKTQMKDSKFGFGGRKRLKKQNDASSAGDMDGFRPGRGQGSKKGKAPRPGKARRQQMKGKK